MGYGQREPVALGQATVQMPPSLDFEALDGAMSRHINEPLPDDLNAATDASKLVARAMHWACALQREVRIPVFGNPYMGPEVEREGGGVSIRLAVPYFAPRATTTALAWVSAAINNFIMNGRLMPAQGEEAEKTQFEAVIRRLQQYLPGGINTYRFLLAAHDRKVPANHFIPTVYSFGMGVHTRWLQSSFTDRTSIIGAKIAGSKFLTAHMMRRAGLPAPTHAPAKTEQEAVQIARRLGYPVVVKPADRQQGVGVAAGLQNDQSVVSAFREAQKHSKNILVEKHFDGTDYRLTVLNGELINVFGRVAGGITGDGEHSIEQLIKIIQAQPNFILRARERGYDPLTLDDEARAMIAEARLTPDAVPAENQYVKLRRRGNISAGGTRQAIELDEVHPDNRRLAERAVSALRLDLGGVDLIAPDITKSWMETGAIICEVNAQPQLGRSMAADVLAVTIKGNGRIPLILAVGQSDCVCREQLLEKVPNPDIVGFASAAGTWLGSERLTGPQANGFTAARILLDNPLTEAAVIVMGPHEIRQQGLPTDSFDAMIFDSPDNWSAEGRETAVEMLELALPHGQRVLSMQPSHPVFANNPLRGQLETATSDTLQHACEDLVRTVFVNPGEVTDSLESRSAFTNVAGTDKTAA